jgi:hypothetical protein
MFSSRVPRALIGILGLALALGSLAMAATATSTSTTPPTATTPTPTPDIPKLAAKFVTDMGLIGPVVCREDTIDGQWTICNAPTYPGITMGITSFVCDAKGCIALPGNMPMPPSTPVPSTTTK